LQLGNVPGLGLHGTFDSSYYQVLLDPRVARITQQPMQPPFPDWLRRKDVGVLQKAADKDAATTAALDPQTILDAYPDGVGHQSDQDLLLRPDLKHRVKRYARNVGLFRRDFRRVFIKMTEFGT
jgi:hypothetical protein